MADTVTRPETPPEQRLTLLRLAGEGGVVLFLVLVAQFGHPVWGFTAFLQLDAEHDDLKITAFKTLPVYVYRDQGGYDGMYNAQIAYDPTLRDPELARGALDNFAYRTRRILAPALAWVVALGRRAGCPYQKVHRHKEEPRWRVVERRRLGPQNSERSVRHL